jgi:hypothetical protein
MVTIQRFKNSLLLVIKMADKSKGDKRPFVVILPKELSREDNVVDYSDIPKIGETFATTASGAVLNYLYRFHHDKAKLIFDKLKNRKEGIECLVFDPSEVVGADGRKITDIAEKREAMEYALADAIASCYHNKPTSEQMFMYVSKAREIITGLFDDFFREQ